MFVSRMEADLLLGWMMHIGWMLRWQRMVGFSPPQSEGQIVDCEATYYDGNTDDLLEVV